MSKRSDVLLINDITEAAEKIALYTKDINYDQFCNDSKTMDAVIRNFEIVGEAANRLTEYFKNMHPEIE